MTTNQPLISVLVCNYNYGEFVLEALNSIKAQTYNNLEIIIIDDGSTDNSVSIINNYIAQNPSLKIELNAKKKNAGICVARNDAINIANGEYFIFLDSDDTIPSNYINTMFKQLTTKKADVVYGDVKAFGGEQYETDYPDFDQRELVKRNYINITSLVRRKSLNSQRFDAYLNRKTHEDYDFWLGLSLMGLKFVKSNNTYLNYRIQITSRNANALNMKERALEVSSIWKYSFLKYQNLYPEKLSQSMVFDFYDYQLAKVGDELMALNDVVQEKLVPELKRREEHIQYLANKKLKQIVKEKLKLKLKLNNNQ